MAHRYAPLPNPGYDASPSQHEREVEMEAAFDGSDDEDDIATESQPLNPHPSSPVTAESEHLHQIGTYSFENVDYDYPPPGSPPLPSATALPNDIGNSNGLIPTFTTPTNRGPHRMWFQRAAATILPSSVSSRLGISQRPRGPIGGGINNDGVFSNVNAKPTLPTRVQDDDGTYFVSEDTRQEAPPSYASAQADAVPPYWETTVHAPFSSDSVGDMVIDNLPTGTIFSFCWNLLVSISFQFIGFLLTYLLHTSHAARFGSRAGLGITLIQYGFAMRSRIDEVGKADWDWSEPDGGVPHKHPFPHGSSSNTTLSTRVSNTTEENTPIVVAESPSEWLSFLLMTIGWFVLLTSLLGFWRVKHWERKILASRGTQNTTPAPAPEINPNYLSRLESSAGLRGISRVQLLRQGFGFGGRYPGEDAAAHAEEGAREPMLVVSPSDPQQARTVAATVESEVRLQRALTEAGFI